MSEISIAALNGKVNALSVVMAQMLASLTPAQAASIAASLVIERQTPRQGGGEGSSGEELATQELMLDAFISLLSAVSSSKR